MKLLLMCDGMVGDAIAELLLEKYPDDLGAVVVTQKNETYFSAYKNNVPSFVFESESQLLRDLAKYEPFDLGILAWWPKLISPSIIAMASNGFINTHPSLLPFNRGKHYNFWALVEEAPFGVTLHFVDHGIDSGDIVAQLPIPCDWEDTGETLYLKAGKAMVDLFKSAYPEIRNGSYKRIPQDQSSGSLHYSKEIDVASFIELDKTYTARELLNLLRARTFPSYPACRFEDDGRIYEIRVDIKRKPE